jgi:hypothetical protein
MSQQDTALLAIAAADGRHSQQARSSEQESRSSHASAESSLG